MNRPLNLAMAFIAAAVLGGCGSPTNTAMPFRPAASHPQSLRPHIEYNFEFSNKTSVSLDVTRLHDSCMAAPPPQTFTIAAGATARFKLHTECLVDPSKFKLSFVSPGKSIDAEYTKDTGNPWKVVRSNVNGLKLNFEVRSISVGVGHSEAWWTHIYSST